MRLINSLKRTTTISRESLDYIKSCEVIYNRVIKEDKKRDHDILVLRTKNNTKTMWQITNKKFGNTIHYDYETDLWNGNEIISNPQNVSERLIYFLLNL